MSVILQVFYSAFSSVLLSLAIPNEIYSFGCPVFTLFALTPFYYAITKAKDFRFAFLAGFIQTFFTHIFSSFWLAYFKDFALFTLGASAIGTGVIGGVIGTVLYLPYNSKNKQNQLFNFSLHQKLFQTRSFKIIYFASIYTLYEWVKSTGYLGYPWGTISSTLYKWSLITQLASITGTYGLTFLFSLLNALIAEKLFEDKRYLSVQNNFYYMLTVKFTLCLFAVSLIYGLYQHDKKRIPQKYLTTIMVQQNSDPWKEKRDHDSIIRSQNLTLNKIEELRKEGKKADFVVWSEGCLKTAFPNGKGLYSVYPPSKPLTDFISEIKLPLLVGGKYIRNAEKAEICNAALMFDEYSNLRGYYGKNHLVPFAEALPGRESEAVRNFLKTKLKISAGWTPGDLYVFFDIKGKWNKDRILPPAKYIDLSKSYSEQTYEENKAPLIRISTPICFDDAFPDVMSPLFNYGSELFVNITDDSWSLKKSSEIQHFVIASFASIEYRTTMLRSSNSGYTTVISPTGQILADSPLFEEYALAFDVPVYEREITFFARFGNWLPHLILFFLAIYCLIEYFSFEESDYIPSARKIKKGRKKSRRKNSKNKK